MTTFQKIYEVAGHIPEGFVATYGQVAAMAGNPRWARVVGYALHVLPDPAFVPWHRVVAKDGRISTASDINGESLQEALLRSEGVTFTLDGRVDLQKHLWKPVDRTGFV